MCSTPLASPRRTVTGVNPNRVSLLLAVLEKRAGLHFSDKDVFVNVAGGVRLPSVLYGGPGNDVYVVNNPGDQVIEYAGQGHDVVYTDLTAYTLPANVEDLIFGTVQVSGSTLPAAGDFTGLFAWLRESVHGIGAKMTVQDLVKEASGRPLSAAPALRYLEAKYLEPR